MSGEEEDELINNAQDEFVQALQDVGLDATYWIPKLNAILCITDVQALGKFGTRDYIKLQAHLRNIFEKKAFFKLINAPEKCFRLCQLQVQRFEYVKEKLELSKQIVKELEHMQSEGRNRNDGIVRDKEKELCLALDVPEKNWFPSDTCLNEIIECMHMHLDLIGASIRHDNISDKDILQNASKGIALTGVYKTGKLKDLMRKREQLLNIPETFDIFGPVQCCSKTKEYEFASLEEESTFQNAKEVMCFCNTMPHTDILHNSQPGTILQHTNEEKEDTSANSYFCNTKSMHLPLASAYFQMEQLKLSDAALNELQNIEKILATHNKEEFQPNLIKSKCGNFFHTFGSHANQGPLEFGGIYWWKASAKGFSATQLNEIKSILSEALEVYAGASHACNVIRCEMKSEILASELNHALSVKYSPEVASMVKLNATTTGGPSDALNLTQWRTAIVSSNNTWSVIDRGINLVPVWDIIMANHGPDFEDVFKLSRDLITTYTSLTDKHSHSEDPLVAIIDMTHSAMQDIKTGEASEAENHLKKLSNLKQKINECAKSNITWNNMCLSHPIFQQFMTNIVSSHLQLSWDDTESIRKMMQCILQPNVYEVENFPQRDFIMQWIYKTDKVTLRDYEINYFMTVLKNVNSYLQESNNAAVSESSFKEAQVKATSDVTASLNALCQCLRECKLVEEELLFLSVAAALGFCVKGRLFNNLLGFEDIDCLQCEVEMAYRKYSIHRAKHISKGQAYVMLYGLSIASQYRQVTHDEKQEHFMFMKLHMENTMCTEVSNVLKSLENTYRDWKQLEEALDSIIMDTFIITENVVREHSTFDQGNQVKLAYSDQPGEDNTEFADCSTKESHDFVDLLKRLDLKKYYPRKIKTSDICVINKFAIGKLPRTDKELAFYYLHKLIMVDYRARHVNCREEDESNDVETGFETTQHATVDDVLEYLMEESNETEAATTDNETYIHPLDLQMAIFHCGDNFTRQYLYTKLALCQLAVPLIIPNPCTGEIEFPLWSLRQIKKSWKSTETATLKNISQHSRVVDAISPIVSFLRLGESSISKSQMLNSLLSKHKHEIFFHRNCIGSTKRPFLMKGVVEIAWYCPGGKNDDVFNDCITFTNLHGDAREHEKQVKFLNEISSINVILMSEQDCNDEGKHILKQLLSSSKPLIWLHTDKETVPRGKTVNSFRIAMKNKNEANTIKEILSVLKVLISSKNETNCLDFHSTIARQHGFTVDEDDDFCQKGKSLARNLLDQIQKEGPACFKDKYLLLQGNLWHSWSELDKQMNRLKVQRNESIESTRSKIELEKLSIRKEQFQNVLPLNTIIEPFIENLKNKSDTVILYFIHFLKMYLDDLSSIILPPVEQKYHEKWMEIRKMKKQNEKDELADKVQLELDALSKEIAAFSFGIDHLFRELSQMYEASQVSSTHVEILHTLPDIAADVMIAGFPLELIDGDTSHVACFWISSVLNKLINKIGDKKIFVLSILGIQGTGKSTLLNTLFGLQFPVSAGRCTKGAYMQLVRVEEELTNELGYDFVLIVDSEGLRSIELSNNSTAHDNELATFIIGLGNVTVINIFGENPSEMQDILQIAVQAFLRMKQVKLSPSCVFVHQNVGDITAREKNLEGKRSFQDKLDKITQVVAEQEMCAVTSFDEVIRFDESTQVRYFSHLWEGNPPMAPPNPSYCQNVQELKQMLLCVGDKKEKCNILKISDFASRIQDIWQALLAENFVFSFKNTEEISAYIHLEEVYQTLTWELRSHVLQLENEVLPLNDNLSKSEVENLVIPKYNEIKQKLLDQFKDSEKAEIWIKWEANFVIALSDVKSDLVHELRNNYQAIQAWKRRDKERSSYKKKLRKEIKEFSLEIRSREVNSEMEMELAFNEEWNKWTTELSNSITHEKVDPKVDVERLLMETFKKESQTLQLKLRNWINKPFVFDHSKHIAICTLGKIPYFTTGCSLFFPLEKSIQKLTNDLLHSSHQLISNKELNKVNYNSVYIHEILVLLNDKMKNFEKDNKLLKLTDDYRIDVTMHVLKEAASRFQIMHDEFQRESDPVTYFNNNKKDYLRTFIIHCKGEAVTIFADFLCNKLKEVIKQAVFDDACVNIVKNIKHDHKSFNDKRSHFERDVLIYLAEKKNFEYFIQYIKYPPFIYEKFIKESIENYCSEKNCENLTKAVHSSLDNYTQTLTSAINNLQTDPHKPKNASLWFDNFREQLQGKLFLSKDSIEEDYEDITNIDSLEEELTKKLKEVMEELNTNVSSLKLSDLEHVRKQPHAILFTQMIGGCWETCPFCNAVCINAVPNHAGDHRALCHLPHAVTGKAYQGTNQFVTDICTSLVVSNYEFENNDVKIPYKFYRKAGPEFEKWSIASTIFTDRYWKWFICKFQHDLEKYYDLKFEGLGKIPRVWKHYTTHEIIRDMALFGSRTPFTDFLFSSRKFIPGLLYVSSLDEINDNY